MERYESASGFAKRYVTGMLAELVLRSVALCCVSLQNGLNLATPRLGSRSREAAGVATANI